MTPSLNYCASLQVELARLRIFTHAFASRAAVDGSSAESFLDKVYMQLRPARLGQVWVYPRLLRNFARTIQECPLQALFQKGGYAEDDARLMASEFVRQSDSLLAAAKQLTDKKATAVLLELARYIRSSVGVGARTDESLYFDLARLLLDKDAQLALRQQLNRWAEWTHGANTASAFDLLSELIAQCPDLSPAQDILEDLLERMEHLIYVPLVFDEGKIGVAIPIKVTANIHQQEAEPLFRVMNQEEQECPPWLQIKPGFAAAVKSGRKRAVRLLSKRGRGVQPDFKITVELPDLRAGQPDSPAQGTPEQVLIYDQGSIEYPVGFALFLQHPSLKSGVPLNPEVMMTGPIDEASLEPKYEALKTVGRAQVLLTISERRFNHRDGRAVLSFRVDNDAVVLEKYFKAVDGHAPLWDRLNRRHSKILSIRDAMWDAPLTPSEARGKWAPPLIPTIKRHQQALDDKFDEAHAVQLQGLSGIGKTFLVAQWLLRVQESYDLVFFISIPSYPPEDRAVSEWATSAFEDLAAQLNTYWGRPELLQKFNSNASLVSTPYDLIRAFQECLSDVRILWVVEHGESLLDKDFAIAEARFAALVRVVSDGYWEKCKLLFVTNRRLEKPFNLPVYEMLDGFTLEEAREYLSPNVWRFPELREEVASILGNHPRALALLVGHAGDYSIHQSKIQEIMRSLPDEQGEVDLREIVCNRILGHVVGHLKSELPDTWWTLLLASTFIEGFNRPQFERVRQALPGKISIFDFHRELSDLNRRSLLNESEGKWWAHSLVRGYAQTIFSKQYPKQFKLAHQKAGETFFPLTKDGRLIPSPSSHIKSQYADSGSCATALYHFETAEYEKGQQAILGNYYEHLIPKTLWWMNNPKYGTNTTYGYMRAERILRKILEVNATRNEDAQYPGAKEVSYDINRLMGNALYRQDRKDKYEEAAFHYREAVRKGHESSLPFLISVLCDLSAVGPEGEAHWLEAQTLFESLSNAMFSDRLPALGGVGRAYEKMARRHVESDDLLLANAIVTEAYEKSIKWDGVYQVGTDIAEREGRTEDAIRWLEKGLQLVPQSARLWNRYYLIKAKDGQLHTLPDELRHYPRGVNAVITLSQLLLKEGLAAESLECLRDAMRNYGESSTIVEYYARLLTQGGEIEGAIKAYKRAISIAPSYHRPYMMLGRLYLSMGDVATALSTYRKGIEATKDGILYVELGECYEEQGDLKEAESVYFDGTSAEVSADQAYWKLGQLYYKQGQLDKAEEAYRLSIMAGPENGYAYLGLGELYESQGRFDSALKVYLKCISVVPQSGFGHIGLGHLYEQQGHLDKAEEVYLHGISASPNYGVLYQSLGRIYKKRNKLKEAEETLLGSLSINSGNGYLYIMLGQIYDMRGRPDKAEEILLKGISKDPQKGRIYIELSQIYEKQDRLDKAEESLVKGISMDPDMGYLYSALGQVYDKQGRPDKAEEILLKGISTIPHSGSAYIVLGSIYEREEQFGRAEEIYLQGLSAASSSSNIYTVLGQLYEKQGRIDQAEEILLKGISAVPNGLGPYLTLGKLYEKRGWFDKAEETLAMGLSAKTTHGFNITFGDVDNSLGEPGAEGRTEFEKTGEGIIQQIYSALQTLHQRKTDSGLSS